MWMYLLSTLGEAIWKVSFGDIVLEVTRIMMAWPQKGCHVADTHTDEAVKSLM
jgi:hypothetical protein